MAILDLRVLQDQMIKPISATEAYINIKHILYVLIYVCICIHTLTYMYICTHTLILILYILIQYTNIYIYVLVYKWCNRPKYLIII